MRKDVKLAPEIALVLAGLLLMRWTRNHREATARMVAPTPGDSTQITELRRALAELDTRLSRQESASAQRFADLEARLGECSAKLSELPSSKQIVAAMEQLLARTMASLGQRLSTQAQAIQISRPLCLNPTLCFDASSNSPEKLLQTARRFKSHLAHAPVSRIRRALRERDACGVEPV